MGKRESSFARLYKANILKNEEGFKVYSQPRDNPQNTSNTLCNQNK
ncbi:hypothetical protein [Cyanobacterium sp. uoEpiScrs1]|nr:hypothetical protein [Cyanobacterium sp. uoEpiScrs1]